MDIVIAVTVAFVMIGLGFMVGSQDYKKPHASLFFILTVILSGWIVSSAFTNHRFGDEIVINIVSNHLAYLFGYFGLLSGLLLTYVFPVEREIPKSRTVLLVAMSLVIGGLSLTDYVAGTVTLSSEGGLVFSSGILLPAYATAFLVIIVLIARNLRRSMGMTDRAVREQARLILVAFVACALVGLSTNVILPLFGMDIELTTRFAPLSAMILVTIVAYAIIRHGLFDVRLAAVRSAAYLLSLLTLSAAYYLLAYAVSVVLFSGRATFDVSISPVNIFLALILAFIFQPVRYFFDRATNRVFYRNRYDRDEFYARLNAVLSSTSDLRSLLQRAAIAIGDTLKSSQAFFFVSYGDAHYITAGTEKYRHLPPRDVEQLDGYIDEHGDDIIVTQLLEKKSPIARLLLAHNISLLVPLVREGALLGYLALGEQLGSGYTKRDVKVLSTIVDELIIAVQNALSVQQVKDINANLEQRIGMATAELRMSNARLKRVDVAKDEFLSMASHQLRTPLTSIKGYLSMVLEGDVGKVTNAQRKVLEEAFLSSERMVHLIHDFLNVSRLQTGKFVLEKSRYDLSKLVGEEVEALRGVAKSRDISIVYQPTRGAVMLDIDDMKLRQVIINYIDNALYYSPKKGAVIVKLSRLPKRVELTVTDTGIGVPKAEQEQLFEKFYRATNARKQRPDGTGVGLYLARKVITAHGGDVVFASKEGKGSTFGFWLPLEDSAQ